MTSMPSANRNFLYDSDKVAYATLICVPTMSFFSFIWTPLADAASIFLALLAAYMTYEKRKERFLRWPIILAYVWLIYLLFSTIYTSIELHEKKEWSGLEKHCPIAFGVLAAVPLSIACHRVRLKLDDLIALFLTGLVAGGVCVLIRRGALDLFFLGMSNPIPALGGLNRNYVALTCGVSIIAIAALTHHFYFNRYSLPRWVINAAIGILGLVFTFEVALLAVTQSRTGYIATSIGLGIWSVVSALSHRSRPPDQKAAIFIPVIFGIEMIGIAAFYFPLVNSRFNETSIDYASDVKQIILGNPIKNSSVIDGDGERLKLTSVATDLIRQRPWLGWGPNVSFLIGKYSPFPSIRDHIQFHNQYLQIMVSFGIIGAMLSAALLAAIAVAGFQKPIHGGSAYRLSSSFFAAGLSLLVFMLLSGFTESIVFVKPAGMTCLFLATMACIRFPSFMSPEWLERRGMAIYNAQDNEAKKSDDALVEAT